MSDQNPVRQERTGWRDQALSSRHRLWGYNCPMDDIDFLVCEYDQCKVVALVEYKNQHAKPHFMSNPNIQALIDLANCAQRPFFVVRYADDLSLFRVVPINHIAKRSTAEAVVMSELEYVTFLYELRGRNIPQSIVQAIEQAA